MVVQKLLQNILCIYVNYRIVPKFQRIYVCVCKYYSVEISIAYKFLG